MRTFGLSVPPLRAASEVGKTLCGHAHRACVDALPGLRRGRSAADQDRELWWRVVRSRPLRTTRSPSRLNHAVAAGQFGLAELRVGDDARAAWGSGDELVVPGVEIDFDGRQDRLPQPSRSLELDRAGGGWRCVRVDVVERCDAEDALPGRAGEETAALRTAHGLHEIDDLPRPLPHEGRGARLSPNAGMGRMSGALITLAFDLGTSVRGKRTATTAPFVLMA